MAITSDLDNIVKWFEEEVCPGILLKVPDDLHFQIQCQ